MKLNFPAALATIALVSIGAPILEAAESFKLETRLYVFRSSGFRTIETARQTEANAKGAVILGSREAVRFDRETLSLEGTRFNWDGGQNPPKGFALVATPLASLSVGAPVTLLSRVATEYLEKRPNGALVVRQISGDSVDAPHYQLTFTIGASASATDGLPMECEIEVAMIVAREPVEGVTLNVGKPVLSRYSEKIEMSVKPGDWSGFLIPTVNGSDFGLLGLMKVETEQTSGLMNADEFHRFATYHYRNPQPELVARAIESLGPSGFVSRGNVGHGCVGFFAEIFAANPDRIEEWRKVIDRQDGRTRALFRRALKLSRPGAILALNQHSKADNEVFWGAFFASGNPAYLRKVIDQLKYLDRGLKWRPAYVPAGYTAMMSLASNLPDHPLVRAQLEDFRSDANPRTRELIGHLLEKDVAGVRQELGVFVDSISLPWPGDNGIMGTRASGDFTPVNPRLELGGKR